MERRQKELLTYIHYILEMNVNDKTKINEHSVEEGGVIETLLVNREEHLEEIMKWAIQEIENNFDLIPEPTTEQ